MLKKQNKNWCFQTVVLEKTLESPLDCKEIKAVNPKGKQSWIFTEATDVEAEAPILWPPGAKSRLIGKHPDGGKDWRQEEKGIREDKMTGWHDRLKGHEFELTLGDGEQQRSLACCNTWGCKESDTISNWIATINLWSKIMPRLRAQAPKSSISCLSGRPATY